MYVEKKLSKKNIPPMFLDEPVLDLKPISGNFLRM
jgi:hypothetical protein